LAFIRHFSNNQERLQISNLQHFLHKRKSFGVYAQKIGSINLKVIKQRRQIVFASVAKIKRFEISKNLPNNYPPINLHCAA
jgi:hypothetical protein